MKPEAFAALKKKSKEAGKAEGVKLAPFMSERFKKIIERMTYKQQQAMLKEYAAGYNGYYFDVRTLPGMFCDVNERKG